MTSHPSIDLFIVAPVALLTQGNWALPCVHVPGCAAIWAWWQEGWTEEGSGDYGSRRTSGCWDLLVMTDVSSGESGVSTVSLHSCSCLQYPSLATLFAPAEHLESWHKIWSCVTVKQPDGSAWNGFDRSGMAWPWAGLGQAGCHHPSLLNKGWHGFSLGPGYPSKAWSVDTCHVKNTMQKPWRTALHTFALKHFELQHYSL